MNQHAGKSDRETYRESCHTTYRKIVPAVCTALGIMALTGGAALAETTLTVAFWGGADDVKLNTEFAKGFEQAHPGVHVNVMQVTGNYDSKVQAMIAGGTPPDVFEMAESFTSYAASGALLDLGPMIAASKLDIGDYFPKVVQAYSYNGHVMALPARWGPMSLFYNKDMFNARGVAYPDDSWTWDTLETDGKKLTHGQGANEIFAIGSIGGWWPWWLTPIYQNGGQLLNQDNTQAAFDTPQAADALDWFAGLIWRDHISPTPGEWKNFPGLGPDQMIEQGKAAMDETGYWLVSGLRGTKLNWDVALLPKGQQRATPLFSNAWGVAKGSQHQQLAFELAEFFTNKESESTIARAGHDVPVRRSVATSEAFLTPGLPPAHAPNIFKAAAYLWLPAHTAKWNDVLNALGGEVNKVLANKEPAKTALDAAATKVNGLLAGK